MKFCLPKFLSCLLFFCDDGVESPLQQQVIPMQQQRDKFETQQSQPFYIPPVTIHDPNRLISQIPRVSSSITSLASPPPILSPNGTEPYVDNSATPIPLREGVSPLIKPLNLSAMPVVRSSQLDELDVSTERYVDSLRQQSGASSFDSMEDVFDSESGEILPIWHDDYIDSYKQLLGNMLRQEGLHKVVEYLKNSSLDYKRPIWNKFCSDYCVDLDEKKIAGKELEDQ